MMKTNFKMEDENIRMFRGNTLAFGVEITDKDKNALALDTAYFTCKADKTDTTAIFQKTLGNGIEKEADGLYKVRVAPDDTALVDAGKYYYDLTIGANGDVYTIMHGILEIELGVTN